MHSGIAENAQFVSFLVLNCNIPDLSNCVRLNLLTEFLDCFIVTEITKRCFFNLVLYCHEQHSLSLVQLLH